MAILSAAELGRRAGVSRQGSSKWIKEWGIPLLTDEKGKKGVDENNPDVVAYIAHATIQRRASGNGQASPGGSAARDTQSPAKVGRGKQAESGATVDTGRGSPGAAGLIIGQFGNLGAAGEKKKRGTESDDESRSGYQARKDKGMAERYELQNRIMRHQYIPTDAVRQVFGRVYSVHTSIICPLGAKLSDQIAAEFGITDPAKVLRVQEIIEGESYPALSQIKREIDDFLSKQGDSVVSESKELAFDEAED